MRLGFLALAAVAVGSTALEVDLGYLATVTDDLHNYLSSNFRSFLQEHASPHPSSSKSECEPCIQDGSRYIIERTMSSMQDKCAKMSNMDGPKACIATKVCGMMAKHPKVVLGMMVQHVRPMSLAMAYCAGKGSCPMPDNITMSEISMGEQPHEAFLATFDKVDWSDVEEQAQELMPLTQYKESMAGPMCEDVMKRMPVKPMCMKRAMRRTMGMAIKKVMGMCANVDKIGCKTLKKMCPWMAQNKEVAVGMLAAKVEPWKFAFGFCIHRGMRHGPLHRGGHKGWHPHHGPPRDGWHSHHGPHWEFEPMPRNDVLV